jgi:cytochrome P450
MEKYCPAYAQPSAKPWVRWWRTAMGRGNLLAGLAEKAYRMQMGTIRVPGKTMFVANDPATVRRVLVEAQPDYPKHRVMDDLLAPLLGQSIFTTNGETWSRQRKLMEPAFELTRMEHAFTPMRDAVREMLERLRARPDGEVCDVELETTHVTADVILRAIFSRAIDKPESMAIFDAFARFQRDAPEATVPLYRKVIWPRWGAARRSKAAAQEIRSLLHALVAPRHAAHHRGEAGEEHDILASLLEARSPDNGQGWSVEELVNEISVLFIAGHETSATALSWAFHLLAHSPEIQRRVHEEAKSAFGTGSPEVEDLRHLELTRRVVRETLRLFPPFSFFVRQAAVPDCLRGKAVNVGDSVVISPWLIQRHRLYWERPDEFDPDRFLTEAGRASASQAYLPFSLGPRVCVGAGFALQEATLVLAMVLREFEVRPVAGRKEPMPIARLTLRSDRGIQLHLHRR